jgi:hypothetical protein
MSTWRHVVVPANHVSRYEPNRQVASGDRIGRRLTSLSTREGVPFRQVEMETDFFLNNINDAPSDSPLLLSVSLPSSPFF